MRWAVFAILAYLSLLAQTTLGTLLRIRSESLGVIAPDLVATVAVFIALKARSASDVAIACWVLGAGLDLTSSAGMGQVTAIGPMALAYATGGYVLFSFREAFFRDKAVSQMTLSIVFCLLAHGLWVSLQGLIAWGSFDVALYGQRLLQAVLLALYTAVLTPPVIALLGRYDRWLIVAGAARAGRER